MSCFRFPTAALLALMVSNAGCGLIDSDVDLQPASAWCDQADDANLMEVELVQREDDGVLVDWRMQLRDADGRSVVDIQWPTDGRPAWRAETKRNADGQIIEVSTDVGLDEVTDSIESSTYDDGRITSTTLDKGNDGTFDRIQTWDYSNPNQVRHIDDTDADGEPDAVNTAFYSDDGAMTRQERDEDGDGTVEWISTYVYSDDGLVTEFTTVNTVSGMSQTYLLEIDEDGRVVGSVRTEEDETGVTLVTEEHHEYDAWGRLAKTVRVEHDLLGTQTTEVTYDYDEEGRLIRTSTRFNPTHPATQVEQNTYDKEGRLVRIEVRDPTGALSSAQEFDYRDGTRPVRSSVDSDGDGTWDWVTTRASCG